MYLDKLSSIVYRIFFALVFVLIAIGLLERLVNMAGYTILRGSYTPGRMFELAAIFSIFVIALLLRQVREQLKKSK
jgi:hypothetical protein